MQNPYDVLGIKEGASVEEIKSAYREQVKKYHPDRYQNNPLYELAEEKLREVNEAYDYLMKNQGSSTGSGGYYSSGSYTGGSYNGGQNGYTDFSQIRRDLDNGQLEKAEQALNQASTRTAEWYFLRGMLSIRKGWYDDAMTNLQTAVRMDPGNYEYTNAMNMLMRTAGGYRGAAYGRGYNSGSDELCRMCECLICLDCCTPDCM